MKPKMIVTTQTINVQPFLCIAFDVAKIKVNYHSKLIFLNKQKNFDGDILNGILDISQLLEEFKNIAKEYGIQRLMVVCESTGGYESKLMSIAANMGFEVHYVPSGHAKKASCIESNDWEKTDEKDAKAIHMVAAKLGKLLKYRNLDGAYRELRELNDWYIEVNDRVVDMKNQLYQAFESLFPEFKKESSYILQTGGQALFEVCGLDPAKINAMGRETFVNAVKKHNKYLSCKRIEEIFEEAMLSLKHKVSLEVMRIRSERFSHLYKKCQAELAEKDKIGAQMVKIFNTTEEAKKLSGLSSISDKAKARIIAETGPLRDFSNYKALIRFAGLNLCRRESGKYKGKTSISKRGRVPLRYTLFQAIWGSLKNKESQFADYYKKKKEEKSGHLPTMVACMRKLLKIMLGAYKSESGYDQRYELEHFQKTA